MSTVTVTPGALITMDPSDKKVILFDFDDVNLAVGATLSSYVLTITAIKQIGLTALTKDNDALAGSNRKVTARFLATTATLGDRYRVAVKGVTSESPAQEKEYSIEILIQDH